MNEPPSNNTLHDLSQPLAEPPASQTLLTLRQILTAAQTANRGKLPLNKSTLSTTSAEALLALFSQQFNISEFTLATLITIGKVEGNLLTVNGDGTLSGKAFSLLLVFTDNFGELDIQVLFSTTNYTDLALAFTRLPQDFFKDVINAGTDPVVNLPAGMPTNVTFTSASYGVMGYYYPSQGYPLAYIVPQIQGSITTTNINTQRSLYLELPTTTSGWRVLSPDKTSWSFTDLAWLLPKADISSNFPGIIPINNVSLDIFQLYLTPDAPAFCSLYLIVTNKTNPTAPLWSVYDNKIQLGYVTITMDLTVTNSSVTCSQQGWIRGAFSLGKAFIFAEIPYPLNSGPWSIDSYPQLTLLDGLDDLATLLPGSSSFSSLLPAGLDTVLNAFELSHLFVAVDPSSLSLQRFLFAVSTTNPWPLIPGVLELENLTVQIDIDKDAKITGGLQCQFKIGNNNVYVSFQRYSANGDWYFVVNSPVIALPTIGDLTELANGTDLSPYIQASGLNTLQFLIYNLNIGVTIGSKTTLTNLGLRLMLSNSGNTSAPKLDWEVIPGVLTLKNFSVQFQLNWTPELKADITGFFTLNSLDFAVKFGRDKNADAFIGAYSPSSTASSQSIEIQSLIKGISPTVAALVPAGLDVELDDIFIAYINIGNKGKKFVFAMDVKIEIPLTGIPLIGDVLSKEAEVEIEDLKIVVVSEELDAEEVAAVNNLITGLPSDMTVQSLPGPIAGQTGAIIPKGFSMVAKLKLGELELLISAPATDAQQNAPASGNTGRSLPAPPTSTMDTSAALLSEQTSSTQLAAVSSLANNPAGNYQSTMWINVQKTFGPVNLEKIGFNYHDGKIFIMLNAALSTGGLTIELLGLGIGSALTKPAIAFDIEGLAISYSAGPLTIAGGMLGTLDPVDFAGALIIETEAFNLAAFGGYATEQDQPSFFLYGLMNEPPLGGPPAFFVTGLAAGFGFNRSLTLPGIGNVYTFPFVSWAVDPSSSPSMDPGQSIGDQVAKTITELSSKGVVAPKVGEYWLAGGIKFSTYEILSSFALLTVSFGTDFEVDLLGISTLKMPPDDPSPIAEVQLEIKVSFSPSTGLFSIAGQLTPNSYILSRDCQLTGGFAFYYWFAKEHEGDFVLSLGGYNSKFSIPKYFPSVPRLGLSWKLSSELSITGELYFTLTSNAVMTGGKLSAVWSSGPIRAWFTVWADFLMVFKPLHYYISAGIDLGASFTIKLLFVRISLTIHIGVSLECWGPEFSGQARINLAIISFTIHFGSDKSDKPNTLPWDQFVSQLLPSLPAKQGSNMLLADSTLAVASTIPALVHIVINKGLIKKLNDDATDPMFLVNGETFTCTVQTVIPSKDTTFVGEVKLAPNKLQPHDSKGNIIVANNNFGAGPANIGPTDFQPSLSIDLQTTEESNFLAVRSFANAPKALWENKQFDKNGVPKTDPNTALHDTAINNTLKGYQLVPYVTPPDHTLPIPKKTLEFTLDDNIQHYRWSVPTYPTSDDFTNETVADTVTASKPTQVRASLLEAMLNQQLAIDKQINVAGLAIPNSNDLMAEPQMRLLGEQRTGA